jgi:hypothetical protein
MAPPWRRTREQLLQQWALTQNNLRSALKSRLGSRRTPAT